MVFVCSDIREPYLKAIREKSPEARFDSTLLAGQEQMHDAEVDLINQRQVFLAFGVLNLVDADGIDLARPPVLQSEVTTCSTASTSFLMKCGRLQQFPSTKADRCSA